MKLNTHLSLIEPCILQCVVHLTEVFICVAHVAIPQPNLFVLIYPEHSPHLLLKLLCETVP